MMSNEELASTLKIAAESIGPEQIALQILLMIAAERIEELDGRIKDALALY